MGLLGSAPMTASDPAPDQNALARLGTAVRARLGAMPGIYRVPDERIELYSCRAGSAGSCAP